MRRFAGAAVVACFGVAFAFADDTSWGGPIAGVGAGCTVSVEHEDGGEYKGWLTVAVTNTGTEAWGDFHFQIFEVTGFGAVDNVNFLDSAYPLGSDPTSSQSPLTWVIDNDVVGATLDLYFYDDPVAPTETATFSVYTQNTDQLSFFGVAFYPTPVPEPMTLLLLGAGGLLIRRR